MTNKQFTAALKREEITTKHIALRLGISRQGLYYKRKTMNFTPQEWEIIESILKIKRHAIRERV
jgi:DNA-binding NtrC family response regulator